MSDFFRFPHTPHLAWLGEGSPRDDKLLSGEVVVEEKLDGANLGISLAADSTLRIQNRGQYLKPPYSGQFSRLSSWLGIHQNALTSHLGPHQILFGEWCAARHSIPYSGLPDWFMVFDVYDRQTERFLSTMRRDALAIRLGFAVVPCLLRGKTTLPSLKQIIISRNSRFNLAPPEGVVIRREDADWLLSRAKLVHPGFTQAIKEHWTRRGIEWNELANPPISKMRLSPKT